MNSALTEYIKKFQEEKLLREKKFPLRLLLLLYYKNRHFFYINYCENLKLFVDWIGPIELPEPIPVPVGVTAEDYYWVWYTVFKYPLGSVYAALKELENGD